MKQKNVAENARNFSKIRKAHAYPNHKLKCQTNDERIAVAIYGKQIHTHRFISRV